MPLQKQVNINPAIGVVGDFASNNPRQTLLAPKAAFRTAADVYIGRFATANVTTGLVSNVITAGNPIGFVGRNTNTAIITDWLGQASLAIKKGYGITLYSKGDFYATADVDANYGDKVFALNATGEVRITATTVADATDTGFTVAVPAKAGELAVITRL